ncbi:PH domain-containing protein [Candidatus Pacearchaeota archaeon]|nr:PH domain-containing protein [Candidatus Pacearchaeota archaeon]
MKKGFDKLSVRNSRKIYLIVYLMILALVISIAVAKISGREIDELTLKVVGVFLILAIFFTESHRLNTYYEVNPHSIIASKGIFSRTTRRLDLVAISDANLRQNLWERMLNYGDVGVRTFSDDSAMVIKKINNPSMFVDFLEAKTRRAKSQRN